MAHEACGFGIQCRNTQFIRYLAVSVLLRGEETELAAGAGLKRIVRIFDYGGKCRVGHGEAARPASCELVGEQAQRVGVALEMGEVAPLGGAQHIAKPAPLPFAEEGGDGFLSRMAEGGIAHVVAQARRGRYVPQVVEQRGPLFLLVFMSQRVGYGIGHTSPHRAYFKAVGKAVMYKYVPWQGEYLGLVLQAAEG